MKKLLISFVLIFISSFSYASLDEGKELFEGKCGNCHSLERSLEKTKDADAWKRTVRRMIRYSRGMITEDDMDPISSYLVSITNPDQPVAAEKPEDEDVEKIADIEDHEVFDFKKVRVSQFAEPSLCGECHSDIYSQWSGSMHSKAFADPLWRAATKMFMKEADTSEARLEMKACVKCHTPLGFRSYSISSPRDDYDKLADLPAQGIFCNWCHNISEVKHLGDAGYEVAPGGGEDDPSTMLGPRKDAHSDYHPTQYSELHTRSEFCGLCHNVTHAANKLPLEATYNEWKDSPYNTGNPETTVHCQDCHMRQRPGVPSTGKTERPDNPGKAADQGPDREHIWTHYFVGGNAVVTKLLGGTVNAEMAVERLQNAADLQIISEDEYKEGLSQIKVKVINSGAGHYLPTGLTEVRQMWLDVSITDSNEMEIMQSGMLDQQGAIDKDAVIYNTVLGNEDGPVANVALADRILYDHRVPPKGYKIEKYSFYIPANASFPLRVKATLKYRSISQPFADQILGDNPIEIPVIDMVSVTESIGHK